MFLKLLYYFTYVWVNEFYIQKLKIVIKKVKSCKYYEMLSQYL